MKTTRLTAVVLMLSLAIGAATTSAASATEDPTEVLLRRGAELRKQDRHDEALELFRKAHAISPSGRTFAQMGLAEFSLRAYVDAEAHLAAALADESPWITKNRAVLERALADVRRHVATLSIVGPPGTDVAVNGKPVGKLPLPEPLHAAEGPVRIEGTAPEHQPATLDVTLVGGKDFKATLELAPLSPSAPPLPVPVSVLGAPIFPASPTAETGYGWKRWLGGSLLAISAAALATGIVWAAIDGNPSCNIPASAPTGSRCGRVYDTRSQGWVAIGVGVATGVGGGILIWEGRGRDVQLGMGPGYINAVGRF